MPWYVCTYADDYEPFVTAYSAETEDQARQSMFAAVDAMLMEADEECISVRVADPQPEGDEADCFMHLDMMYGPFTSMVHPMQQMMDGLVQRGVLRRSGT